MKFHVDVFRIRSDVRFRQASIPDAPNVCIVVTVGTFREDTTSGDPISLNWGMKYRYGTGVIGIDNEVESATFGLHDRDWGCGVGDSPVFFLPQLWIKTDGQETLYI